MYIRRGSVSFRAGIRCEAKFGSVIGKIYLFDWARGLQFEAGCLSQSFA